MELPFGVLLWQRPIDLHAPTCSPATLAGLTVYPTPSQHVVFSARVGVTRKQDARWSTTGHFTLATSYSRTACRRTTIGAAAFHFRVRNGNGWCHCAIITRILRRNFGTEFWWSDQGSVAERLITRHMSLVICFKERQFPGTYIQVSESCASHSDAATTSEF